MALSGRPSIRYPGLPVAVRSSRRVPWPDCPAISGDDRQSMRQRANDGEPHEHEQPPEYSFEQADDQSANKGEQEANQD